MTVRQISHNMGEVTPFATSTEIGFADLRNSVLQGLGMGIGLSLAGFLIITIVGKKLW